MTTSQRLQSDPDNLPGPIQAKRISKAASRLLWHSKSTTEVLGIIGNPESESRHTVTLMFGGEVSNPRAVELYEEIGERFGWTVTKDNAAEMFKALKEAEAEAIAAIPEVDKRRAPEEVAEQAQQLREREEKRERETAERDVALAAILAKRPLKARALIIAELDGDECDTMTDYFGHRTERAVAIGWRTGKREDFRQLRRAAAIFEPTAHLGPGCDVWTARAYREEYTGPDHYREMQDFRDAEYRPVEATTEEELRALIAERIAEDTAKPPPKVCEWGDLADRYGFEVSSRSVEHRENYSMGAGNYLKAGHNDSSGWRVRSYPLDDNGGLGWGPTRALADALPGSSPSSSAASSPTAASCLTPAVEGNGYTIQEAQNKRGGFSLVVLAERVDRETFSDLRASAKDAGGWYSRKWGKQSGGFGFDSREAAQGWASSIFDQPDDPSRDIDDGEDPEEDEGCAKCGREKGEDYTIGCPGCFDDEHRDEPEPEEDEHPEGGDLYDRFLRSSSEVSFSLLLDFLGLYQKVTVELLAEKGSALLAIEKPGSRQSLGRVRLVDNGGEVGVVPLAGDGLGDFYPLRLSRGLIDPSELCGQVMASARRQLDDPTSGLGGDAGAFHLCATYPRCCARVAEAGQNCPEHGGGDSSTSDNSNNPQE